MAFVEIFSTFNFNWLLNLLIKCSTKREMSSFGSRSGGIVMENTSKRYSKSKRNFPCLTSSSRLRFDAEIMRTSTNTALLPPIRLTFFSSNTRSSFTCASSCSSPISSKKSVPLFACSNFPICKSLASEKHPFHIQTVHSL